MDYYQQLWYSQFYSNNSNYAFDQNSQNALRQMQQMGYNQPKEVIRMDGRKPLVVCNGVVQEADTMDLAVKLAEELAHQKNTNAFVLKPVKQVAPKRDVVTTDL